MLQTEDEQVEDEPIDLPAMLRERLEGAQNRRKRIGINKGEKEAFERDTELGRKRLPIKILRRNAFPVSTGYLKVVRSQTPSEGEREKSTYAIIFERFGDLNSNALTVYSGIAKQSGLSLLATIESYNYNGLALGVTAKFASVARDYSHFQDLVKAFTYYEFDGKNYFIANSVLELLEKSPRDVNKEDIGHLTSRLDVKTLSKGDNNLFVAPRGRLGRFLKGPEQIEDQTTEMYGVGNIVRLERGIDDITNPELLHEGHKQTLRQSERQASKLLANQAYESGEIAAAFGFI